MTARTRVRRAVRRRVATLSLAVAADRGPAGARRLVARARVAEAARLLRGAADPGSALRVLDEVLRLDQPPEVRTRALALVAEARTRLGDRAGALAAARDAVAARPSHEALLVRHRLAVRAGLAEEAADTLATLVDVRPRNRRQLSGVLTALHDGDHAEVRRLRHNLEAWGLAGHEEDLEEADAAIDLRGATEDRLECELARAASRLVDPVPVVTRELDRRRAWTGLLAYVEAHPPTATTVSGRRRAALELRRAASRALTAGWAETAAGLAGHALALHPDDRYATETWAHATDQVRVAREGWPAPAVAPRPRYDARRGAVLSVLAQSLPHQSGGYATRSHGVLTGLRGLGWDVEAVTRLGFPYDRWPAGDQRTVAAYDEVDGVRYHRILDEGARAYPQHPLTAYVDRYARALEEHARRHRPALLHASSFHVNGLATRQAAARLGVPYVYEMRGLEDLMKVSRDPVFDGSDRRRFLDRVELASCMGAERVFVITDALRREMAARGVPEEKLVVLPNGVHTDRFQPQERDRELEERLGLRDRTVIGYAGGLVDYEGLELLLDAVDALRTRRDDFRLVVVGDGHHQGAVRAHAAGLGLGDMVTFTGRVPHEEVARYLSLFDITPFPRLPLPVCELISPIKPFEAMATGRAVVVSSVAALTEIVQDGVTGLAFEKGSAADLARVLEALLDDPGLRLKLGESARSWVRRERDWATVVETVDAAYRQILSAGRRRAPRPRW